MEKIIIEDKATNYQTDQIPSKFIKMFKVYLTPVITSLISFSLMTGRFAKDWNTSTNI